MTRLKTPLRYPGGKSKATTRMSPYFPTKFEVTHYREPFLGGGSVALWMTQNYNLESVWVNDLYWPLYNFWVHLRDRGEELSNALMETKNNFSTPDKARDLFLKANRELSDKETTDFEKAVNFWIVNKCSFSGLTEISSFSEQASNGCFTLNGIENLKHYSKMIKNWKITCQSYENLLSPQESCFVYLDPPYEIEKGLYGKGRSMHNGFDHDLFAKRCNANVDNLTMAVSYNNTDAIKDRFDGWKENTFALTYSMNNQSKIGRAHV